MKFVIEPMPDEDFQRLLAEMNDPQNVERLTTEFITRTVNPKRDVDAEPLGENEDPVARKAGWLQRGINGDLFLTPAGCGFWEPQAEGMYLGNVEKGRKNEK